MTRTEILTRYRRLRQISNEHHHAVLGNIAPDVLLDWAKRIGVAEGKTVVFENEHELTLVQDLATYLPRPGRSHPLDRYARTARFVPGSDEAIVLEAMRHARFSVWRIERRHDIAGVILRDVLRDEETWLVDETMEKNPPVGLEIAGRFLRPEGFAMNARIVVPVIPDLLKQLFDRNPALKGSQGDVLLRDPRFVIGIYELPWRQERWTVSASCGDRRQSAPVALTKGCCRRSQAPEWRLATRPFEPLMKDAGLWMACRAAIFGPLMETRFANC